ncbi:hypothetical protein KP79_PYT14301 [Mizuhopecten yessoensis]|uniref:Methyltransferase FkbM domain-containing protein n=1 Tax=Mizuhopecten yessoensis TaxID=6573 RepID=A0A210PNB8_MIZYE|nr:hypothetical protein KP79_PYT14301 [Mizuhopecten yessoensis]
MKRRRAKLRIVVGITFVLLISSMVLYYSLFYKPIASVCRRNFRKYPHSVYTMSNGEWTQNSGVCGECPDFWNATLVSPAGKTPMFIHNPQFDEEISATLKRKHAYEPETAVVLFDLLKNEPEANFIDIGANIGVHTLPIAQYGRKVISVEALHFNIEPLCASVDVGNLHDRVTIVHNAMTNRRGIVTLGADDGNLGGTFVDVDSKHVKALKGGRIHGNWLNPVNTVTFDDLLDLPVISDFSKVLVKIDIEGSEYKALQKSKLFFQRTTVIGVFMEWEFHRKMRSGEDIIRYMENANFVPYFPSKAKTILNTRNSSTWPYDVMWLPK